jgi:galactose mutarotase-like enzyme
MIHLENDYLKASFLTKGAEWRSLVSKPKGQEFLWQADPAFWGKTAPLLFPIIGLLKGGQYQHEGKSYSMGRHGLARDREFEVVEQEAWRVVFLQKSDATSRLAYPFDWELEVEYRLWKRVIHTTLRVRNTGSVTLPFSLGGHPAFAMPLGGGEEAFDDGFLDFELVEPLERWLLDANGLLSGDSRPLPTAGRSLVLTRDLLSEDAVVIRQPKSSRVTLRAKGSPYSLSLEFPGFTHLGIWSPPNAPFVCVEPWCGVTDSVNATGNLADKEGIQLLATGASFERSFAITLEA